jgi:hypothetical protein
MNLSLAAAPGKVPEDRLHDRVRARLAPVLVDDKIAVAPADPVGGGPPCAVEDCPRPQRYSGFCCYHNSQLRNAGRPEISSWNSPRPDPGPELLDLGRQLGFLTFTIDQLDELIGRTRRPSTQGNVCTTLGVPREDWDLFSDYLSGISKAFGSRRRRPHTGDSGGMAEPRRLSG